MSVVRVETKIEKVAREFHESYEDFAVANGWKTQDASRVSWDDLPDANKATVLDTVTDLLRRRVISAPRTDSEEAEKEDEELEAVQLVGCSYREKGKGRGVKRHTITLTERIPYWGFRGYRGDGSWQLNDRALRDYYEPISASGRSA